MTATIVVGWDPLTPRSARYLTPDHGLTVEPDEALTLGSRADAERLAANLSRRRHEGRRWKPTTKQGATHAHDHQATHRRPSIRAGNRVDPADPGPVDLGDW